jgi:hypothetical protein
MYREMSGEETDPLPLYALRAIPHDRLRELAEAAGVDLSTAVENDPDVGRTIRVSALRKLAAIATGSARKVLADLVAWADDEIAVRRKGVWNDPPLG